MNPKTKSVTLRKSLDEIRDELSGCKTADHPSMVLREADKELAGKEGMQSVSSPESNLFKSMTLFEFDNGALLTTTIPNQYKTFGIDLMNKLQKDFDCQISSEKATAELVAVNFIRTLEIQRRITKNLIGRIATI